MEIIKLGEILSFYLFTKDNYYVTQKRDSTYVNGGNWVLLVSIRNCSYVFFFWLVLFVP